MTFDPDKPVQTRDGRKARILCTDAEHRCIEGDIFPIIALITNVSGQEIPETFRENGFIQRSDIARPDDLINIPEKRWAVLFKDGSWTRCSDGACAAIIDEQGNKVTACVEFTEGDGLD